MSILSYAAATNSPIKRLGYVVLIVGIVVFAVALVLFFAIEYRRHFFYELFRRRGDGYREFILTGLSVSVIGFLMSYAYDATIGRLVDWVLNGRH